MEQMECRKYMSPKRPFISLFSKKWNNSNITEHMYVFKKKFKGAAVVEWLSSWLAEQEVRGSIPGLTTWISEIGYLLLPSRDMAEIPLKRRKSSIQPTENAGPVQFTMEAGYGHCRVIALSRYRLVHNAITRQRDNATTR